ncbi:hypothetical protein A3K73_01425 [Candidatus Pacearchaeota archaeon RBG_13_36_9]|nr:MAG: hypothetical protein A3K73_01425 [Candidatus Pacearchaeota archaeon RBG_13_36_9]
MEAREIDRALSHLELDISPDLRESASQLMKGSYEPLKADEETLSEVSGEIRDAEKAVDKMESVLPVSPPHRKKEIEKELSDRVVRLEFLKAELDLLKDAGTQGKRRWEYSVVSQRIKSAESFAKVCMGVMRWRDKAGFKDKLRQLKTLRAMADEEYIDVKFVRITPSSQRAAKPEPKPDFSEQTQQILYAFKYPELECVESFNMPRGAREAFEGRKYNAIWACPQKPMRDIFVGHEFPVSFYLFNWNKGDKLKITLRIDSDYFTIDSPKSRTFVLPTFADSVKYSAKVRVDKFVEGEWIDAKEASRWNGRYNIGSGLFLPGRITAHFRIDPGLPEQSASLYLPILRKEYEKEPRQLSGVRT